MADDGYCQDCKRPTEVAYDHANGDAICVECGLVLESHMVDETAEWRTFTDDSTDNDPVRIGAPSNPFLQGKLLETTVVDVRKERRGSQVTNYITRAAAAAAGNNKSYSSLVQAFSRIDDFCERLGVNKIVKDLACDLYVKVHPFIIETRRDNSVVAACVHIACQKENQSRTLREMRMVTGVQEKKIVMAKNSVTNILNEKVQFMKLGVGTEQTSDYLKRFAHNFGLNNRAIKAALEILKKSEEHDIRRSPTSIAAGIVYITCQLCGIADIKYLPEVPDNISIVANTAEGTIKSTVKDLQPYLTLIVPSWFANESDLEKLLAA
ncbi:hypothetical protein QQ045_002394 [Rhodiola kirilowii]